MLFSILQTLGLWGINPRQWLTGYLTACAENGGRAPEELAPRCPRPNPQVQLSERSDPGQRLQQAAKLLTPMNFQRGEHKTDSRLWNESIQRYHYLGHKPLPGAQLRYLIDFARQQPLALLGFGAAAWLCAPRDQYIGWNHSQRRCNLHAVVNNARFLILPWIHAPNLASMI